MFRYLTVSHSVLALVMTAACLPCLASFAEAQETAAELVPDASQRIIDKTNRFRTEQELSALKSDPELKKTAEEFAKFMARESKYGHGADGRRPAERAEAAGYDYCVVRENIAYRVDPNNPDAQDLAEGFFTGWKDSEEHRENMLADFVTETGVAVATVDQQTFYAVQLFGRPESAKFKVTITNSLDAPHTLHFKTTFGKDSIEIPSRVKLTISRCVPTEIRIDDSKQSVTVVEPTEYTLTRRNAAAPDSEIILRRTDTGR